jgi:hypothetical protein
MVPDKICIYGVNGGTMSTSGRRKGAENRRDRELSIPADMTAVFSRRFRRQLSGALSSFLDAESASRQTLENLNAKRERQLRKA